MILLDPDARPIIAHRGNRAFAPENTLQSFREAIALGVDGLEFDVHVSRDNTLVVVHDPTLDRTTNGHGAIMNYTVVELQTFDAGAQFTRDGGLTFPWRGRGVTISTFDEVIESLPPHLPCIVELKTPRATEPIRRAIQRHGIAQRVIVAGFDPAATRPLQGAGFALGASTPDVTKLLLPALLGHDAIATSFQALCIPPRWHGLPLPVKALTRALRKSRVVTHVWTINNPAHALRLWTDGVNGIISDDPALMLATRRQ